MKPAYVKRLVIFFAILATCLLVLLILSDGKIWLPDASSYRRYLYPYAFFVMPLIILADVIYLFSAFINNPLKITLISLVGGVIGPLFLYYSVQTSKDPMAAMAFIGLVVFYAVASMLIFLLMTLIQICRSRLRK